MACLAVLMHVVPNSTIQNTVLPARDSWMRFQVRSNRTQPSRFPNSKRFAELRLRHINASRGSSPSVRHATATGGNLNLRYAGYSGISLASDPQLVDDQNLRTFGADARTGHYLVDILSRVPFFFKQEHFMPAENKTPSRPPVEPTSSQEIYWV